MKYVYKTLNNKNELVPYTDLFRNKKEAEYFYNLHAENIEQLTKRTLVLCKAPFTIEIKYHYHYKLH